MTMKSERVIKEVLVRMADEAPPPLDLEELGSPVLGQSTFDPRRSGRSRLAAIAAVAFVGVLAVAALLVSRPNVSVVPVGSPTASSAEEFATVIVDAFQELRAADGVEGVERHYTDGQLVDQIWFTTRPNGDSAFVSRSFDSDEQSQIRVSVSLGGNAYVATETATWDVQTSQSSLANSPIRPLLGDSDTLDHVPLESDSEVTRQDASDGGSFWTVDDGLLMQTFHVHPDGYVDSWVFEFSQPPAHDLYRTRLFDQAAILYAPLTEPEQIPRPTIGSPLGNRVLDLQERFTEAPTFENP